MSAVTGTCHVATSGAPDEVCGGPAYALVLAGCVHEHTTTTPVCLFHLTVRRFSCRPCWLGAGPHHCPVSICDLTEVIA